MKTTHTPGPWNWYPLAVQCEYDIQIETKSNPRARNETKIALCKDSPGDANLISAAPELLAALEGMVENWDDQFGQWSCDCRPEPQNAGHVCNVCQARAAISKAKGQQ